MSLLLGSIFFCFPIDSWPHSVFLNEGRLQLIFCIHFVSSCCDRPFSYSGVQHERSSTYRRGVVFVVINSIRTVVPCCLRHSVHIVYVLPSYTTHSSSLSILLTLGGGGLYTRAFVVCVDISPYTLPQRQSQHH